MKQIEKEIEQLISNDKKIILEQKNHIEKLEQEKIELFRTLINDILSLIDTHDNALSTIKEKEWDKNEISLKIIERYATIKSKAVNLLTKRGVERINFPDNNLILEYCKTVDTEPNSSLENNTIISIEKEGYIKGKEVIREAEVIIVKN